MSSNLEKVLFVFLLRPKNTNFIHFKFVFIILWGQKFKFYHFGAKIKQKTPKFATFDQFSIN